MKCKKCRREIADNSIFCSWCGYKQLTEAKETRVPTPTHRGNLWSSQIMLDGERVYVTAESEAEYYAKARAIKDGLVKIKKAAPRLTLGTAIDNYIKVNDSVLSPSTINAYKSYRKTRFSAYMDSDVWQINYQQMVNEEARNYAPKTVHNAWRLVTAALRHADVPVPSINLPQKPKAERPFLDYQQIQILLDKCKGKPYELGILLALHGLRRSEILHLTSDDIDIGKGLIHVRGASVVGAENRLIDKKTNKNRTSTRDVHIVIPQLTDAIKGINGRLITTNPTTLYGLINGLCERNGLPQVGVHGLRHSYVALCFHLGVSPDTVMREGGWSNLQTVNNVYRHLSELDKNEDICKLAQFFDK